MTNSRLSSLCMGCFCLLMLLSSGCKKDTLEGELMAFHGRYQMEFYTYTQCFLCTKVYTGYASNLDYSSAIEFTPEGKVIFYIDNEELHKTAFKIVASDITDPSRLLLDIDPIVEDVKGLDLNNEISFQLINDTLHTVDFPGESYDKDIHGNFRFLRTQ